MKKNIGPDYDTDVVKHYVRRKGWLQPFISISKKAERDFKNNKRDQRFKYLTFCAKNAVDVFMLEKEGVLYRDPNSKRLVNVFFCEERDEDFVTIRNLIGSENQGFYGNFGKLIFEDYSTISLPSEDEEFPEFDDVTDRTLLRLKESQQNLFENFPFDIINFDIYGNTFPQSDNRYSEQCKIFKKILELQKRGANYKISKFLLYLTVYTPVSKDQVNTATIEEFRKILFSNLSYPFFKKGIKETYKTSSIDELDFHIKYTLGFLKLIILRESYGMGWNVKLIDLYSYDRVFAARSEPYKMSCYIIEFQRSKNLDNVDDFRGSVPELVETDYTNQLKKFLSDLPIDVPDESKIEVEIKSDLKKVVEFRKAYEESLKNQ